MTPKPLWSFRLPKERQAKVREPVFCGELVIQVFFYRKGAFYESTVIAFDAQTGDARWQDTIGHIWMAPVVGPDRTIYLASFEGSVYAYAPDGTLSWKGPGAERNIGSPCLVGDDRLAFAELGQGRRTWCLDRRNGQVAWTYETGGYGYPIASDGGTVVHAIARRKPGGRITDSVSRLFALSAEEGTELWSVSPESYLFMSVIVDDCAIVGARGALLAYRLRDGRPEARLDLGSEEAAAVVTPFGQGLLLSDNAAIEHTQTRPVLRSVSLRRSRSLFGRPARSFASNWVTPAPCGVVGRPLPIGTAVAVLGEDGTLRFLDAATGDAIRSFQTHPEGSDRGGCAASQSHLALAQGRSLTVYRLGDLDLQA